MPELKNWELKDEDDVDDAMANRYLLFHMGDEDYGIGIEFVIEIIGLQRITEVPDMPAYVKGVINLRGQVIPVVDVRLRFGLEKKKYTERTCVIVVDVGGMQLGLIVDGVSEVQEIPESKISTPPEIHKCAANQFIEGMGRINNEVKILLNMNKLLFEEDIAQIAAAAS